MELRHIKETSCPICGCNIIENERVELDKFSDKLKVRLHCNGQQWEHRTFACGQRLSWIPNFNDVEISEFYVCSNNQEYIERKQKREKSKEWVIQYINSLETVDQEFKERMAHEIKIIWV